MVPAIIINSRATCGVALCATLGNANFPASQTTGMKKLRYNFGVLASVIGSGLQFIACFALLLPMALLPQSARKAIDALLSAQDNGWY